MKARWIEFNVVGEADRPSGVGRFVLYADLSASGYAELHLRDCNGNRHRVTEQGVIRLTEITPDVADLFGEQRHALFVADMDGVGITGLLIGDFTLMMRWAALPSQ